MPNNEHKNSITRKHETRCLRTEDNKISSFLDPWFRAFMTIIASEVGRVTRVYHEGMEV